MSFSFELPVFADGTVSCNEITSDDPDRVCSEKYIYDNPKILTSIKSASVFNGANAIFAPTAGATHLRLTDFGIDNNFSEINQFIVNETIKVANKAAVGGVVASSISFSAPYEKSNFEEIYFAYLEKITVLKNAGADFILFCNQNNLFDMRAGILSANAVKIPSAAVIAVDEDGKSTSGTDFIASLITLQSCGIKAFGIDCTDGIKAQIELISKAFVHSEIPLIAVIDTQKNNESDILELAKSGASVFIDKASWKNKDILKKLSQYPIRFKSSGAKDSYAAANDCEAFFLPDDLELSVPIKCGYDMPDEIIDLDDESIDAVHIFLNLTDDSSFLAANERMSKFPFIVHANDSTTLEAALRYYQGRLIVDTRCEIDETTLKELSKKYGAILY